MSDTTQHDGLRALEPSADRVFFLGDLAACQRFAAAHGYRVVEEWKRIIGIHHNLPMYGTETTGYELRTDDGRHGLIVIDRDGWVLVMERPLLERVLIWEAEQATAQPATEDV